MGNLINGMSFGKIRTRLGNYGTTLTDEQFENLTYSELKTIYRKAEKITRLQSEIAQIADKPAKKMIVKAKVN